MREQGLIVSLKDPFFENNYDADGRVVEVPCPRWCSPKPLYGIGVDMFYRMVHPPLCPNTPVPRYGSDYVAFVTRPADPTGYLLKKE